MIGGGRERRWPICAIGPSFIDQTDSTSELARIETPDREFAVLLREAPKNEFVFGDLFNKCRRPLPGYNNNGDSG